MNRRLITVADDFGLTQSVNEAVEDAANHGILTSASLMVGGPAFDDAVKRARRCPKLRVGLHLVVIEGPAVLPPEKIPALVDHNGEFASAQFKLGLNYYVRPDVRRQLAAEIRAQFQKFADAGLQLDHANAHKHMHLHPTIGRMMIGIGRDFGLRAIRVPAEPARPGQTLADRMLRRWCGVLRRQARGAGMLTNDHVLGLADTGHLTQATVRQLLATMPPGLSEMYFHPATRREPLLASRMPDYEHEAEWRALLDSKLPTDIELVSYSSILDEKLKQAIQP